MKNKKLLENNAKWRKTERGVVTNIYSHMKFRNVVEFDLEYLHSFSKCKKFDRLFKEWVKSNYNKQMKPSIDRINRKKGYVVGNIQWVTWAENRFKQSMERRNRSPKVAQILDNKVIKIFASQRAAVIETGLNQSNLSMALTGKRKYCGGYKWEYIHENPELL